MLHLFIILTIIVTAVIVWNTIEIDKLISFLWNLYREEDSNWQSDQSIQRLYIVTWKFQ